MSPERPALHVIASFGAETDMSSALDPSVAFRRHAGYVAAIAHRLLGRDDEVDDTVQEVFVAAVRGLSSIRNPAAVRAWLGRVTVRVARRRLRQRRWRALLGIDQAIDYETVADAAASPEQRLLIGRVYGALDRMPSSLRIAWTLRYVEGEQLEQVAALSGCSLATAKRRIAAARRRLEEELDV